MSAYHARPHKRPVAYLAAILTVFLIGCGDSSTPSDPVSGQDPKAAPRRKEMADFMKNQPPGGSTTGSTAKP